MARIFMDGFESGDFGLYSANATYPAINNLKAGRVGNYCAYYAAVTGALSINFPVQKSSIYLSEKISINLLSSLGQIIYFYNSSTVMGTVAIDSTSNKILLYKGNLATLLGTSVTALEESASAGWNLLEFYYLPHLTAGSFVLKLNGITEINISGISTSPSTLDITSIGISGYSNIYYYIDDIIIDDANWIGPSSIQGLVPTGAGATTQFDPSTGSNYACVDEIPPSDTDYISTNVANEIDTYVCGNLTGTINSIKAVQVQAKCMQEGSPAVPKIQLVTRPTSTDRVSASKNVQTFQPGVASNIWELNPDDSAAWEAADVNGMEIGVKAVAS